MKFLGFLLFCLFLVIVLLCLVYLLSFWGSFFYQKAASFECGFYNFSGSNFSFSMPFFVISLMFLLFDVEILLVCFYPMSSSFSFYNSFLMWGLLFLISVATFYEWAKGVLNWV